MQTTFERETTRMMGIVTEKVANFTDSRRPMDMEGLTRIFQRHTRSKMDAAEWEKLLRAISAARAQEKPIPIGIQWAVGGHARNHFKFLEPDILLPRLGDFWAVFWFMMLDAKVRLYHEQGIEVVVVDEVPQSMLMGWTPEEAMHRRAPVETLASRYAPFMRFAELPSFETERVKATVGEPPPGMVYAICCSLPHVDLPEEAYQWQYTSREKPWEQVCSAIPEAVWVHARQVAIEMAKLSAARKEAGWLRQILGRPYIDAAITEKGRFSPDIWGSGFPQHGGTVLKAEDRGQFSVRIEPESRLLGNGHEPVRVQANEISSTAAGNASYVFYWQERR